MGIFILDLGSGNTSKNSLEIIDKMVDAIAEIDIERKFILKFQLFEEAGDNIPLEKPVFRDAYNYATGKGFNVTASVFDKENLEYLLNYDIPFVKIANRFDLYHLIGEVPRKIAVLTSVDHYDIKNENLLFCNKLCCVSEYPATIEQYEKAFKPNELLQGISDHTSTWELFEKYRPLVYEVHFCLEDSEGPDAGIFSRRPKDLEYIINYMD